MKRFKLLGLVAAIISLLCLSASSAFAQKNNGAADDQASKKYQFELAKSWSFGYENYKNKQYQSAAKHFWRLTRIDTVKRFPKVYRYLGDSYLKMDRADSAQIIFELGIEKYPDDPHLHRMRGFLLGQRSQFEDAIGAYEEVVALEPESLDDWMQLADVYIRNDQIEDAIAAYDKVLELDPDNLDAQKKKTGAYGLLGDTEAIIAEKEKIRERDPENSQVRFELGNDYFRQGNFELAIERFNEFLALQPNDIQAMEMVGVSYQRLEQWNDAINQFKAILELEPKNKKILTDISASYRALGRFQTARTYARRALNVDNQYGRAWIALGEVYETCAQRCVDKRGGTVKFDDKLVFELAAAQYRKALSDYESRQEAERHLAYLQGAVPTTEDKFMHKGQKEAEGDCYTWIY